MPRLREPPESAVSSRVPGSFRDPSGFLFWSGGKLYRQINAGYRAHYDHFIASGLYDELVEASLIVPHESAEPELALTSEAYLVIRPRRLRFVSYPYEWCFSELQDAAAATLELQKRALARGMVLKDASAFNIQFHHGRPLLVDTLSFELYEEGEPWVAYRQFCEHFLGPLALMSRVDPELASLSRAHLDGIPVGLASKLLPFRTKLRPSLLTHVHLHAKTRALRGAGRGDASARVSRRGMLALIDSLESAVDGLRPPASASHWARYYRDHRYTDRALAHKKELVDRFLAATAPESAWDLGANTGLFSRLCAERDIATLALDGDHDAIEAAYRQHRDSGSRKDFLPLVMDLTNPSPSLGWAHQERMSLAERAPADVVLALALVHHLAIAGNVPLPDLARFFAELGRWLVVEFVPKDDEQTKRLLASRRDVWPDYEIGTFERAFEAAFSIEERCPIEGSRRTLYLMRNRRPI